MNRSLVIVGAGGLGREVRWLAEQCDRSVLGYLDDGKAPDEPIGDLRILGPIGDWRRHAFAEFIVAVGEPRVRLDIVRRMQSLGSPRFASLVHPSVLRSASVHHGEGLVMAAGCMVTVDVTIGRHVVIDRGTMIGHDCRLGDFCTTAPMAAIAGDVHLGAGVNIGQAACIRQGVRMGAGSMLGMGGVLTQDVAENCVVVGNPARMLKQLSPFDTRGGDSGNDVELGPEA